MGVHGRKRAVLLSMRDAILSRRHQSDPKQHALRTPHTAGNVLAWRTRKIPNSSNYSVRSCFTRKSLRAHVRRTFCEASHYADRPNTTCLRVLVRTQIHTSTLVENATTSAAQDSKQMTPSSNSQRCAPCDATCALCALPLAPHRNLAQPSRRKQPTCVMSPRLPPLVCAAVDKLSDSGHGHG